MNVQKQKGTYRYWMLTWNNPPEDWQCALTSLGATYVIGQLEKGENGVPHIQGCAYYETPIRAAYWSKKPLWAKGINAADFGRVSNYSKKSETRIEGPFEDGKRPSVRKGARDYELAKSLAKENRIEEVEGSIYICQYLNLKRIAFDHSEAVDRQDTCGIWICGPPGTGKSHYVRTAHQSLYIKPQNKWWDGFNNHSTVLLDDFDKHGVCLGHYLKIWADKWKAIGEIKGGTVALTYKLFYVTSNYDIEELFREDQVLCQAILRRFKVYRLDSRGGQLTEQHTDQMEERLKYFIKVMSL